MVLPLLSPQPGAPSPGSAQVEVVNRLAKDALPTSTLSGAARLGAEPPDETSVRPQLMPLRAIFSGRSRRPSSAAFHCGQRCHPHATFARLGRCPAPHHGPPPSTSAARHGRSGQFTRGHCALSSCCCRAEALQPGAWPATPAAPLAHPAAPPSGVLQP
jgi:hypothetical protein